MSFSYLRNAIRVRNRRELAMCRPGGRAGREEGERTSRGSPFWSFVCCPVSGRSVPHRASDRVGGGDAVTVGARRVASAMSAFAAFTRYRGTVGGFLHPSRSTAAVFR